MSPESYSDHVREQRETMDATIQTSLTPSATVLVVVAVVVVVHVDIDVAGEQSFTQDP